MTRIFIAMPSLPDTELFNTINSAYDNADNPKDLFIGINFSYYDKKDLKALKDFIYNKNNITIIEKKLNKNKKKNVGNIGTGVSRIASSSLYSGQEYFLQTDSHMLFDKSWDTSLIDLYKRAKSYVKNDKIVITAYPGPHIYEEDGVYRSKKPRRSVFLRDLFFCDIVPKWIDDEVPLNIGLFLPAIKTSGSFIFGDRHFAEYTGLESYIHFLDEELIQTINLLWENFSLVFPNVENLPLTHMYNQNINSFGGERMSASDFCEESITEDLIKNSYLKYINLYPQKVEKFYKYSYVHPKLGSLKNGYIPEDFNR